MAIDPKELTIPGMFDPLFEESQSSCASLEVMGALIDPFAISTTPHAAASVGTQSP